MSWVNRYSDHCNWKPIAEGLTNAFKDWPELVVTRYGNMAIGLSGRGDKDMPTLSRTLLASTSEARL
jgi:hypothetical protein